MGRRLDIIGVVDATGTTFETGAVTVTAAATKIPPTNLANRKAITIMNLDTDNTVYIGNAGVTTATGFALLPYTTFPIDLSSGATIYGICDAGKTAVVRYLEVDNG